MALFILHKLILQTRMCSHPVGLEVYFLVWLFVYFHISYVRTAKALVRLCECAGLPEPSLVAYVISAIISWAGSIMMVDKSLIGCLYFNHLVRVIHVPGSAARIPSRDYMMLSMYAFLFSSSLFWPVLGIIHTLQISSLESPVWHWVQLKLRAK